MHIQFIEVIINPYNGKIEHVIELSSPIERRHITPKEPPSIPVAIPPNPPLQQKEWIYKQFAIESTEHIHSSDLVKVFDDSEPENDSNMPGFSSGADKAITDKINQFFGIDETTQAYNHARIINNMAPIEAYTDAITKKPKKEFTPTLSK